MEEKTICKEKRKRIKANYTGKYYSSYAYNRIKKKYPDITFSLIHKAMTYYFELAQEDLAMGNKFNFLNKLGNLYLTKEQKSIEYNDEGKLINTLPINIYESLKLWRQNPELRGKTFVRFTNDHSDNYVFSLHFERSKAIFKNKNIYNFQFSRTLKQKLVKNINNKKVDAFLINKKINEQ